MAFDHAFLKHETRNTGQLTLTDTKAEAKWREENNMPGTLLPFGETFDWEYRHPEWVTLSQAKKIAATHGIKEVEEF